MSGESSGTPTPAPLKPHLVRAIYLWCIAESLTPYIEADTRVDDNIRVPQSLIKDGRITFNLHPQAVRDLTMEGYMVRFHARFGGRPFDVQVPMGTVTKIYCMEQHHGFSFTVRRVKENAEEAPPPPRPSKAPRLRLVKNASPSE